MDDARLVRVLEGLTDLEGDADGVLEGNALPLHTVLERLALDIFHGDEALALIGARLVDLADEGMVEGRRRSGFADEPLLHSRVVGELLGQELQGDVPFEDRVAREIDLAHAAAADETDDLVMLEAVALIQHEQSSTLSATNGAALSLLGVISLVVPSGWPVWSPYSMRSRASQSEESRLYGRAKISAFGISKRPSRDG
jgi:hypothetical protein